MVLESIAEAGESGSDFALETTLSGRSYLRVIRDLRNIDYRIRERVRKGGHNVPTADVRRRFPGTLDNLFHLYRPLLDTLRFFTIPPVNRA